MTVYVILVTPEASFGRVSSEGYCTLEEAQAFIESRAGSPVQKDPYYYIDNDYCTYKIFEVKI